MTSDTLFELRLYLGSTARAARVAANNCRLNGYKQVASEKENEAAFGEKLLRALAREKTDPVNGQSTFGGA